MTKCCLCDAEIPANKWSHIRAHDAGWFFTIDGKDAYCPEHNPPWVKAWRARKVMGSGG